MPEDEAGKYDPLERLAQIIGGDFDDSDFEIADFDDIPAPTHWPSLPATDTADEWNDLRAWVTHIQRRFGHLDHHVIPRCWWRHNDHVEVLVALRDHEHSSFASNAPATGPLEWFRALRDMTAVLKTWTADLGCGTTHTARPSPLRSTDTGEWDRFVVADVTRRADREVDRAAQ